MMIEEIDSDGSGTVDFDGKVVARAEILPRILAQCTFSHAA